jgi:hypothetical protein
MLLSVVMYRRAAAPVAAPQKFGPGASPAPAWSQPPAATAESAASVDAEPRPPEEPANPAEPVLAEPMKAANPAKVKPPPASAQPPQTPPSSQDIQDPLARAALSFVGADPDAEEYWIQAINNPNLSAHERKDLIEDLNEDGLSDPQNPTLDDLPLIISRLLLIEELASDALDDVNWDAFLEAYKDLANMFVRLTEP